MHVDPQHLAQDVIGDRTLEERLPPAARLVADHELRHAVRLGATATALACPLLPSLPFPPLDRVGGPCSLSAGGGEERHLPEFSPRAETAR